MIQHGWIDERCIIVKEELSAESMHYKIMDVGIETKKAKRVQVVRSYNTKLNAANSNHPISHNVETLAMCTDLFSGPCCLFPSPSLCCVRFSWTTHSRIVHASPLKASSGLAWVWINDTSLQRRSARPVGIHSVHPMTLGSSLQRIVLRRVRLQLLIVMQLLKLTGRCGKTA